jgi:hypothetical protein
MRMADICPRWAHSFCNVVYWHWNGPKENKPFFSVTSFTLNEFGRSPVFLCTACTHLNMCPWDHCPDIKPTWRKMLSFSSTRLTWWPWTQHFSIWLTVYNKASKYRVSTGNLNIGNVLWRNTARQSEPAFIHWNTTANVLNKSVHIQMQRFAARGVTFEELTTPEQTPPPTTTEHTHTECVYRAGFEEEWLTEQK